MTTHAKNRRFSTQGRTCLAGLMLAFAFTTPLQAQEDRTNEARSLYDAGAVAFGDGRFEDALRRWEEAYAISDLPALLYNIGTAHDRLGHAAEAIASYTSYLEQEPDAQNANYTRSRIEILRGQLPASENDEPDTPSEEVEAVEEHEEPAPPPPESRSLAGPIALIAAGGAVLATGVALAFVTNARYGDLEDRCPAGVCPEGSQGDIDQVNRLGLSADILMGAGGAAAVGGLVWLLVGGGDEDSRQALQVDVAPDRVLLRGRF